MTTESKVRLTPKQEYFCLYYFTIPNASQAALKAGYSRQTAPFIGSENLKKPQIIARLAELAANKPPDPDIADVEERKRRLTHHLRAEIADFVDASGKVQLSKDIPHHVAVSEYSITTIGHDDGEQVTKKSLKLRDPIAAIQALNRMA